jgi:hypothetical protein
MSYFNSSLHLYVFFQPSNILNLSSGFPFILKIVSKRDDFLLRYFLRLERHICICNHLSSNWSLSFRLRMDRLVYILISWLQYPQFFLHHLNSLSLTNELISSLTSWILSKVSSLDASLLPLTFIAFVILECGALKFHLHFALLSRIHSNLFRISFLEFPIIPREHKQSFYFT